MKRKVLPNLLTIFRVLAIPAVVASFYVSCECARYLTLAIFSLACVTDFFDGYLARVWGAQSRFGKLFDPVADKLMLLSTFVMLVYMDDIGGLSAVCVVVMVCREVLVSGMREFLITVGIGLPVSDMGKLKTLSQMLAAGVLIVGRDEIIVLVGKVLLYAATALSAYSMYLYTRTAVEKTGI
ncbi:MAG: CDP-diacylglycerol--glycerol-3-phosphate 3-phosphatidyltransferase [Anaplasma sp.]